MPPLPPLRALARLLLLLLCPALLPAASELCYAPASDWVETLEPAQTATTATVAPASGLAYELCDYQNHLGRQESYTRIATRVLTEYGRGNCGELRFAYEPSYQTLTFHHVRIERDGAILDRLDPAKVKILQRETSAEAGIYNGRHTALVIVEDLRVGDRLDYAFSIRGENPVFAGRYTDSWTLQVASPVERYRVRLLGPPERPLSWRILGGDAIPPASAARDGLTEWSWDRRAIPGLDYESGAPAWHLQYPVLQISEYADWAAVADWGRQLYPLDSPLPPELERFIASLAQSPPAERAAAALQCIQTEVRYLSLSLGESSHRPHAPATVYAQRFGDCKDKAFLLAVLLQRLGLDAVPALVDADCGATLDRWLPSPFVFDHAIVHLALAGEDYWLDPTRAYQAGPLAERSITTFGWALPLRPGTRSLVLVRPTSATLHRVETTEAFTSTASDQPVALRVRRLFRGPAAEGMRGYLADNTAERVGKDRLNRYAQLFPSIQLAAPPTWSDDRERNRIEIEERFTIPGFWTHDDAAGKYSGEVVPLILNEQVDTPASPHRRAPLAFSHPFELANRIVLDLHEAIDGGAVDWTERTAAFTFAKKTTNRKQRFEIEYLYRSEADHVPAEKCPEYAAQIGRIRERLGHTFTFAKDTAPSPSPDSSGAPATGPAPSAGFALNWPIALLLSLALPVGAYLAWRLSRPAPPAPPPLPPAPGEPDLRGIGGWLILVAINLVVGLVRTAAGNIQTLPPVLNLHVWHPLTTPGQPNYHPLFAPALLGEAAFNLIVAGSLLLAGFLFITQRRRFPQVMIFILGFSVVFSLGDAIALANLPGQSQAETFKNIGTTLGTAIAASVWIPYYLVSRRVRLTFVR